MGSGKCESLLLQPELMRLLQGRGQPSGGAACSASSKPSSTPANLITAGEKKQKKTTRKDVGEMCSSFDLALKSGFLAGFPGISVLGTWWCFNSISAVQLLCSGIYPGCPLSLQPGSHMEPESNAQG